MKDREIRSVLLKWFYENRRGDLACPEPHDLTPQIPEADILAVCDQLGEHGYLDWKAVRDGSIVLRGFGKITAYGIDIVENEGRGSTVDLDLNFMQNISFHSPANVQIGNHNVQTITQALGDLVKRIDDSAASDAEKSEAKSRLKAFLEHPLVTSAVGGLASSIPGLFASTSG